MGLRDTWHRALVYFGLAEEPEYDYASVVTTDLPVSGSRTVILDY